MGLFDLFKTKKETKETIEIEYPVKDSMRSKKLIKVNIGPISLPSGKIIAGDPFRTSARTPFVRSVKPGVYQVCLYMIEIESGHFRVAFAKIKFRHEPASRWILAVTESMNLEQLQNMPHGNFMGFPVKSGLAAFVDAETGASYQQEIASFYRKYPVGSFMDDFLEKGFKACTKDNPYTNEGAIWNNHKVANDDHNVTMFSSGWGDGTYPTYWGLNRKGETVELSIDFKIGADVD